MSFIVWMLCLDALFLVLHSVAGHSYAVACKTSLALSGHRRYQYQTSLGSAQVRLRRNRDVLACGSELTSGESLGIDVQNNFVGGDELIEVLGGASITAEGSRCRKTRSLTSEASVLIGKGEVAIQVHVTPDFSTNINQRQNNLTICVPSQLAYGGANRGVVYVSPICKYTIKTGPDPVQPENQSVACPPPKARFGRTCQCPSANCFLTYGDHCEASVPCIDFWNSTIVVTAPTHLGQRSAALLNLGIQGVFEPARPLSVQVATYNISALAQRGALGLDSLGPSVPVSLLADIQPAGLLFRAGPASLTLAYNPRLVSNASALLALRFNESTAAWEPVPAAHDAASASFLLPLTESGRYAVFEPGRARLPGSATAPAPPPPPAGLYAEASLAVLTLSGVFAFLHVGFPLLVRVLEPSDPGKARAERGFAAATAELVVDNSRRRPGPARDMA